MGCDIHLRVEARRKGDVNGWRNAGFMGEFRNRNYGMFARMADVRSYDGDYKVKFMPRGLPEDLTDWSTLETFCLSVTDNEERAKYDERCRSRKEAEKLVEEGRSKWMTEYEITDPDYHSHSWLTTQELRQCYDDCFKQEITYDSMWYGLISLCEGIESEGTYECRVVFAFDN